MNTYATDIFIWLCKHEKISSLVKNKKFDSRNVSSRENVQFIQEERSALDFASNYGKQIRACATIVTCLQKKNRYQAQC